MRMVYATLLTLCIFVTCSFDGCTVPPQPGTSGGGFPVATETIVEDSSGTMISTSPVPGIAVLGNWVEDNTNAAGSTKSFAVTTDDDGNAFVNGGRINSVWDTSILWNPPCGTVSEDSDVDSNVNPITGHFVDLLPSANHYRR
jgi:hypothetical protein